MSVRSPLILLALLGLAIGNALAPTPASADPVSITEAPALTWGFKHSWRFYVSQPAVSGGAAIVPEATPAAHNLTWQFASGTLRRRGRHDGPALPGHGALDEVQLPAEPERRDAPARLQRLAGRRPARRHGHRPGDHDQPRYGDDLRPGHQPPARAPGSSRTSAASTSSRSTSAPSRRRSPTARRPGARSRPRPTPPRPPSSAATTSPASPSTRSASPTPARAARPTCRRASTRPARPSSPSTRNEIVVPSGDDGQQVQLVVGRPHAPARALPHVGRRRPGVDLPGLRPRHDAEARHAAVTADDLGPGAAGRHHRRPRVHAGPVTARPAPLDPLRPRHRHLRAWRDRRSRSRPRPSAAAELGPGRQARVRGRADRARRRRSVDFDHHVWQLLTYTEQPDGTWAKTAYDLPGFGAGLNGRRLPAPRRGRKRRSLIIPGDIRVRLPRDPGVVAPTTVPGAFRIVTHDDGTATVEPIAGTDVPNAFRRAVRRGRRRARRAGRAAPQQPGSGVPAPVQTVDVTPAGGGRSSPTPPSTSARSTARASATRRSSRSTPRTGRCG